METTGKERRRIKREKEIDTAVKPRKERLKKIKEKTPEEMTYGELKVLLSDCSIYGDYYFRVYRAARKFRNFYTDFEMKRTYDYDEYRESRYDEDLLEDRDLWRPNCGISGNYNWKALVAEGKRREEQRQRKKQKQRENAEAAAVGLETEC